MMLAFGGKVRTSLIAPITAIGLMATAGCGEDEAPTSPTEPAPHGQQQPTAPPPTPAEQGGETNKAGSVGRDLNKDMATPVPEHGASVKFEPAAKPDSVTNPAKDTRAGQP